MLLFYRLHFLDLLDDLGVESRGILLFLDVVVAQTHNLEDRFLFFLVRERRVEFPEACDQLLLDGLLEVVRSLLAGNRVDLHGQVHCDELAELLDLRRPVELGGVLLEDAHAGQSDQLRIQVEQHLLAVLLVVERGRPVLQVGLLGLLLQELELLRLDPVQLDLERLQDVEQVLVAELVRQVRFYQVQAVVEQRFEVAVVSRSQEHAS